MPTWKNIVVATDFSDVSDEALALGRDLARAFKARLHLVHAIPPMTADATGAADTFATTMVVPVVIEMEEIERTEQARLEELISSADRKQLGATAEVRTMQAPSHAIVDYAREHAADVIVVGTHSRKGLARLFMSSVAEQVIRHAHCPVLVVPKSHIHIG